MRCEHLCRARLWGGGGGVVEIDIIAGSKWVRGCEMWEVDLVLRRLGGKVESGEYWNVNTL